MKDKDPALHQFGAHAVGEEEGSFTAALESSQPLEFTDLPGFPVVKAVDPRDLAQALTARDLAPAVMERHDAQVLQATSLSRLESHVGSIAREMQRGNDNAAKLNGALGEFKTQQVEPLREELKHLRYNAGARMEQTTRELEVVVHHFGKVLPMMLKASGMSQEAIDAYMSNHGLKMEEAPRAAELNIYAETLQDLRDQLEKATQQVQRLLQQIEIRHEFFEKETGWECHQGCQCRLCAPVYARTLAAQQAQDRGEPPTLQPLTPAELEAITRRASMRPSGTGAS